MGLSVTLSRFEWLLLTICCSPTVQRRSGPSVSPTFRSSTLSTSRVPGLSSLPSTRSSSTLCKSDPPFPFFGLALKPPLRGPQQSSTRAQEVDGGQGNPPRGLLPSRIDE